MKAFYVFLTALLLITSCTRQSKGPVHQTQQTDTEAFGALTALLTAERQINSVIVSQNGNVIYDYYLSEDDKNRSYNFNSVAKSITSLIAGIAIDNGFIKSEDAYISDYFPQIQGDEEKSAIQIKHLLSMTSGISWPESTAWNHFFRPMIESGNWIEFILSRDMSDKPGEIFNYNSGNHHLMSKIIQDAAGKNMLIFGQERLFDSLGIRSVSWYDDPQGVCFGGAWITMTPKDALKIGQLILDGGTYNNREIVSPGWIAKMTSTQSGGYTWNDYIGGEYGYGWWIRYYRDHKTVYAWGANEQYIFVTPDLNLVAVFNSAFRNQKATRPPVLYSDYVIKSLLPEKGA